MRSYIVASVGDWNADLFSKHSNDLSGDWYYVKNPDELGDVLTKISPRYIFFPHWRWIVPNSTLEKYESVCFHMTDLPYGRGGSPLQNLIIQGHKSTVISALKMEEELDTGPIYMKRPLSLEGAAYEIYKKASAIIWEMIKEMVVKEPKPLKQLGDGIKFKRREPNESLIPPELSLERVYDYIRMLDAPGYPRAYLETESYRLEFEKANYSDNKLSAKVYFYLKK